MDKQYPDQDIVLILTNVCQSCPVMFVYSLLLILMILGATLNKGFNRALGTFSAGGLALGIAEISLLAGEFEEVIIVLSVFIAGQSCKLLNINLYEREFGSYLSSYLLCAATFTCCTCGLSDLFFISC